MLCIYILNRILPIGLDDPLKQWKERSSLKLIQTLDAHSGIVDIDQHRGIYTKARVWVSKKFCKIPDGPFLGVEHRQAHAVAPPQKLNRLAQISPPICASHLSLLLRTFLWDKLRSIRCKQLHHAESRPWADTHNSCLHETPALYYFLGTALYLRCNITSKDLLTVERQP